jgi:hypothetical protein
MVELPVVDSTLRVAEQSLRTERRSIEGYRDTGCL